MRTGSETTNAITDPSGDQTGAGCDPYGAGSTKSVRRPRPAAVMTSSVVRSAPVPSSPVVEANARSVPSGDQAALPVAKRATSRSPRPSAPITRKVRCRRYARRRPSGDQTAVPRSTPPRRSVLDLPVARVTTRSPTACLPSMLTAAARPSGEMAAVATGGEGQHAPAPTAAEIDLGDDKPAQTDLRGVVHVDDAACRRGRSGRGRAQAGRSCGEDEQRDHHDAREA